MTPFGETQVITPINGVIFLEFIAQGLTFEEESEELVSLDFGMLQSLQFVSGDTFQLNPKLGVVEDTAVGWNLGIASPLGIYARGSAHKSRTGGLVV